MFQDFDDRTESHATAERLAALRVRLREKGLSAYLVPRADEHQGEYVAPYAERLAWLTGFTGSAGIAVVLHDRAALFVDGRYTLQARDQVQAASIDVIHLAEKSVEVWLDEQMPTDGVLGYDPWLHTPDAIARYANALERRRTRLVAITPNLIDEIWPNKPTLPKGPIRIHDVTLAGRSSQEKRKDIATSLVKAGIDSAVLTLPDSIAWLLNIRGNDVKHTPIVLSYAILHADGRADLYVQAEKLSADVITHLGPDVAIHPYTDFARGLSALEGKRVRLDHSTAPIATLTVLENAKAIVVKGADPCQLPKATKNATELDGMRQAHIRDGAALVRFLAWLAAEAPKAAVDEIAAAKMLERFRADTGVLEDLSFDTISGAGPNGAVVHYRVTPRTNRKLAPGDLFLIDSGGQYRDGTTDVTRTVAIGSPPHEAIRHFTLVLKGHIALARARFPEGTSGGQLDILARLALWQAGLDFDHGTGHGVGAFLSVHEGPQRISKAGFDVALRPGMIVSNEPGYYRTCHYGIRIENLMAVTAATPIDGGERPMLGFETLTLAPIDLALVDPTLLSPDEKIWLNAYHARVFDVLSPRLERHEIDFMRMATRRI